MCIIHETKYSFYINTTKNLMTCKWKKYWKYCFFFDVWAMYANMIICRVIPQKDTEINIGYQLLLYFVKCSSQGYCYKNPNYFLFCFCLHLNNPQVHKNVGANKNTSLIRENQKIKWDWKIMYKVFNSKSCYEFNRKLGEYNIHKRKRWNISNNRNL